MFLFGSGMGSAIKKCHVLQKLVNSNLFLPKKRKKYSNNFFHWKKSMGQNRQKFIITTALPTTLLALRNLNDFARNFFGGSNQRRFFV